MTPSRGIICWDKKQFMPTFSRWEMAWTSFDCPAKMYENVGNEIRIHPTQKPVALYRWILSNYSKPGDKIIDTHSGSGSLACACHLEGFDFLAIEKDEDYYKASVERYNKLIDTSSKTKSQSLFTTLKKDKEIIKTNKLYNIPKGDK